MEIELVSLYLKMRKLKKYEREERNKPYIVTTPWTTDKLTIDPSEIRPYIISTQPTWTYISDGTSTTQLLHGGLGGSGQGCSSYTVSNYVSSAGNYVGELGSGTITLNTDNIDVDALRNAFGVLRAEPLTVTIP